MTVRLIANRILVQPNKVENISKGGILIPDGAEDKVIEGKVIAVGPGKTLADGKFQTMLVREGDTVIYGEYAGTKLSLEGDEYVVMTDAEILIIKGD